MCKIKRTQTREYPISVSALFCCFFTTTDSSHKGNEIPVGNKLVFEDLGVVSQPDFLG